MNKNDQSDGQPHHQIEPLLAVYRELDESQRQWVDAHVQRCPVCARQLAAFQAVDRQLEALREYDGAQRQELLAQGRPDLAAFRAQHDKAGDLASPLRHFLAPLRRSTQHATAILGAVLLLAIAGLFASWVASLSQAGSQARQVTPDGSAVAAQEEPAVKTSTVEQLPAAGATGAPNLGRVAYVQEGDIWMKELPDGAPQRLTDGGDNREPLWAPSGARLAFLKDDILWLLDVNAPEEAYSLQTTASGGFAWSPVVDHLVFTAGNKLQLLEAESGGMRTLVSLPEDGEDMYRLLHPFWRPDGSAIAYERYRTPAGVSDTFQGDHGIWLVELDSGETVELVNSGIPERGEAVLAGWTFDGRYLLFWQGDVLSASLLMDGAPLYALRVDGQIDGNESDEPIAMTVPAAGQPAAPMLVRQDFLAPAPHSSEVAIVLDGGRDVWGNKKVGGAAPETEIWRSYTPEDRVAISPTWSPDGRQLAMVTMPADAATGEGAMRARRVEVWGNGQWRQLTDDPAYRDENPLWSAGGRHILFARLDQNNRASLWLVPVAGGDAHMVVEELSPPPADTGWSGVYRYVDWSQYYDWWRDPAGVAVTPEAEDPTPPVRPTLPPTATPDVSLFYYDLRKQVLFLSSDLAPKK